MIFETEDKPFAKRDFFMTYKAKNDYESFKGKA